MSKEAIFKAGNVAVVTGAALGIGRAMAIRFAEMGMSVVLADLAGDDFEDSIQAVIKTSANGSDAVLGVATDVSDVAQIAYLKSRTLTRFGKVDFLANNAVTRIGKGTNASIEDWQRAMDVNLWGPIYGVRAFLPSMLANASPAAIVNVGSKQGITNPPGHPVYNMTKSALKTYTEALQHSLRIDPENQGDGQVSAHLLVPGWTTTGKAEHRAGAWLPEQVVAEMIRAIVEDHFYIICPDGEVSPEMDRSRILWAAQDITENRPPLSRWHPDYVGKSKAAGC